MIRDPARLTLAVLLYLAALGSPVFVMGAFFAWHSRASKGFIRNVDTVDIRVERVASGESWILPAQGELAATPGRYRVDAREAEFNYDPSDTVIFQCYVWPAERGGVRAIRVEDYFGRAFKDSVVVLQVTLSCVASLIAAYSIGGSRKMPAIKPAHEDAAADDRPQAGDHA